MVLLSVLIWSTVVTKMQTMGYIVATIGLLFHFLGAETIKSVFRRQKGIKGRSENFIAVAWWRKRLVATFGLIFVVFVAGSTAGFFAAYKRANVEALPNSWYSTSQLSGTWSEYNGSGSV